MEEMITQCVVNSAGSLLRLAGDAIMAYLGWPGLIALAAGALLLVSLSAQTMRFIATPKGMGVTALVLIASLLAMGWLWPKLTSAASPVRELASSEPETRRASKPQPPVKRIEAAKLETEESLPVLAAKEPLKLAEWFSRPLGYPLVEAVSAGVPLPPPPVVALSQAPAVVVQPKPSGKAGHLTPFHAYRPSASYSGRSGSLARMPAARPQHVGPIFSTPGYSGTARANAPFTIHQWNNQLMHNPGAMQSMMGMGHMGFGGGEFHPHVGGFSHPGHMGHIGGHH